MLRNVQPLPALAPKGRRNPNTIIMQSQQQLAKPTPTMAKTVGLCLFVLVAFVAFPNGKYSNKYMLDYLFILFKHDTNTG